MKTTLLGVFTILVAVGGTGIKVLNGEPVDFATVLAAVTAGLGLLKAQDSE